MNVTVKKTTISTSTSSWEAGLVDEAGVLYATISGKVDSTRPFGSVTLTVHNQSAFKANEVAAKAAYEEFERLFDAMVASIEPLATVEESEAITA